MKILHAADFHLDSPFQRLSVEQALVRRREQRELPAALARVAREENVDLVLLPGDLFDGARIFPETVEALSAALESMGVPVVIAPGNHDYVGVNSPYLSAKWPDNVHIFTRAAMDRVDFPSLGCVVHGCAFTEPHRFDEPLSGFYAPDDGQIHLLCVHGEVGMGGDCGPIPPSALAVSGAAYAALGHIHAATGLNWEGDTPWAYCGCPEGRGFDELGEKGALIVTLDDNGVAVRAKSLCRRQYRIERVPVDRFEAALPTVPRADLVRIILTGECQRAPDLKELLSRAKDRFFYMELRDETTLPHALWARKDEDSLTGLFLREMHCRLEAAAEEDRPSVLLAARFGLAALEGGEDVCP